jgi:hypothetical protein
MLWWLSHVPQGSGATNGFLDNWWRYVFDFNGTLLQCSAPGTASSCNAQSGCSWYTCANTCLRTGTDVQLVCEPENYCSQFQSLQTCNANKATNPISGEKACQWYLCTNSCMPTGSSCP